MNNVTIKKSPIEGIGVYVNKNFSVGDTILVIDDTHIVSDETKLTPQQHEYDCDYLSNGTVILMQEPERLINHSCNPNTYVKTINGLRHVLAMKDIKKDEEITCDYAINGSNDGTFKCNCGSKNCRKIYQGNFFKLPRDLQLKYLPYLDDWFIKEHQQEINLIK
jgi:hypothetical protein